MSGSILNRLRNGSIEDRINQSYIPVTEIGCWIWIRSIDKDGYGIFYYKGNKYRAHRVSYELFNNVKIEKDLLACHKCDNPSCINPSHIFIGSHKDNAQDALSKNRHFKGELNGRSKLTESQVMAIHDSNIKGAILANHYGVTKTLINQIKREDIWCHLWN